MELNIRQAAIDPLSKLYLRAICKRSKIVHFNTTALVIARFHFDLNHLTRYQTFFGFDTQSMPLSYPFVASQPAQLQWLTDRHNQLTLLGLIHSGVHFWHDPCWANDPARWSQPHHLQLRLSHCQSKETGYHFSLTAEWRSLDEQQLVASYQSDYFIRHKQPLHQKQQRDGAVKPPIFEPLTDISPLEAQPLTGQFARQYAALSGDFNPIHLSSLTARPFGFRRAIAHGMSMVAMLLAKQQNVGALAAKKYATNARFEFLRPVLIPSTVYSPEGSGTLYSAEGKTLIKGEYILK